MVKTLQGVKSVLFARKHADAATDRKSTRLNSSHVD